MQQFAEGYPDVEFVQEVLGQLPWGHIVLLLTHVHNSVSRRWYICQTIYNGWSKDMLDNYIKLELFEKQTEKLIFQRKKRDVMANSVLSHELTQDPYIESFLKSHIVTE